MAFDAGMVRALANELDLTLKNAKIEKVQQPEKDEILFVFRAFPVASNGAAETDKNASEAALTPDNVNSEESRKSESQAEKTTESGSGKPLGRNPQVRRLLISCGANNPRICLTERVKENPQKPPMFCMQLRKYLTGAKLLSVRQLDFERALEIEFEAYDLFGYECKKYIIVELMGKYSNVIFCDEDKKIQNAIRIIELSPQQKRPILPGLVYELPPAQNKLNPLNTNQNEFTIRFYEALKLDNSDSSNQAKTEIPFSAEKFICGTYMGIASLVAREIAFRSTVAEGDVIADDMAAEACEKLWRAFSEVYEALKANKAEPYIVRDCDGKPIEYSFIQIKQYGSIATAVKLSSFSELIDDYFYERDLREHIKQRSSDIMKLLTNAESRLQKKIALQQEELKKCEGKDRYKLFGDVIRDNIYKLERPSGKLRLTNYYAENADGQEEIYIEFDGKLNPAQNMQRYYKRYNKAKVAEIELAKQIKIAESELEYIYTVFDSLTKASVESELEEIRYELYESGYASKMKNYSVRKNVRTKPMEFRSSSGLTVLCGKNNTQNDYLTTKFADKSDYWFHAKNAPGSHVILVLNSADTGNTEPSDEDLTEAAEIAAYYSKVSDSNVDGTRQMNVAVDYTKVGQVKKPSGSKPGFVIYHTNRTAYVSPKKDKIESMRVR